MNWKQHLLLGFFVIGICFLAGTVRQIERESPSPYQPHLECSSVKGDADYTWVFVDIEGKQHCVKVKRLK